MQKVSRLSSVKKSYEHIREEIIGILTEAKKELEHECSPYLIKVLDEDIKAVDESDNPMELMRIIQRREDWLSGVKDTIKEIRQEYVNSSKNHKTKTEEE